MVIYTADLQVLMLERAGWPGFWQSVTGSIDHEDEPLIETAAREVREETGIDASHYRLADWGIENRFEIFKKNLSRYAEGVTHNEEHVFGLELPQIVPVRLEPTEHLRYDGCRGRRPPSARRRGPTATPSCCCRKDAAHAADPGRNSGPAKLRHPSVSARPQARSIPRPWHPGASRMLRPSGLSLARPHSRNGRAVA